MFKINAIMNKKEKENINKTYFAVLDKIVAERKAQGLTQMDICKYLGIGENGYFKVEKGSTKLDVPRLLNILEFLKISPSTFFKEFK